MARRKVPVEIEIPARPSGFVVMLTFFTGLFIIGLGMFLGISFFTADTTLDPATTASDCATGLLGAWAAFGVRLTLGGVASYALSLLLCAWGIFIIRNNRFFGAWPQVLGGVVALIALPLLVDSVFGASAVESCGLLSYIVSPPARLYLGNFGLAIIAGGLLLFGGVLMVGEALFEWGRIVGDGLKTVGGIFVSATSAAAEHVKPKVVSVVAGSASRAVALLNPPKERESVRPVREKIREEREEEISEAFEVEAAVVEEKPEPVVPEVPETEKGENAEFVPYGEPTPEPVSEPIPVVEKKPPVRRAERPEKIDKVVANSVDAERDYQLPPMYLLDEAQEGLGEGAASLEKRAKILEKTLAEFKIEGKVVQIECGPRVTLFEMMLAPGIRLSKVISLGDNISMALKAANVRIIAPIPGKDTIGIEIPNIEKNVVSLREVVEAVKRNNRLQQIPVCLGKDVSGTPIIADLAKMPHMLIAGATGSGKSVCINSLILSVMMCCKPSEAKLLMIDPKVVELSRFKEIPHLLSPVITDMKKAVGVLEWACQKMDERYEQLSMVSVNNIVKFNALGEAEIEKRLAGNYGKEELELFPKSLPYIVIVIDELADLMLVAGKDVEQHITRLAAKSRAVGIHVVLATQRPSVDVITGLIKANMPCRIAFQVASRVDSRTILDQNGAETLLGAGDMLFLPPGVGKLTRAQGVFVSDEELFRVVDFVKAQMAPEYHQELDGPVIGGAGGDIKDFDELFGEAGMAIIESGRGSVSLLQRKFGVGYGRASRIIDQLAAAGLLGPFREGKAREIMMTMEEFCAKFCGGQSSLMFDDDDDGGMAGLRDDEKEREDVPWDDEA
jgi:S-DNA-T family DNA segregation ATPase FtsK/SpoIIIE